MDFTKNPGIFRVLDGPKGGGGQHTLKNSSDLESARKINLESTFYAFKFRPGTHFFVVVNPGGFVCLLPYEFCEFESRCYFYRVRLLERNSKMHSLQLTELMGGALETNSFKQKSMFDNIFNKLKLLH